MELRDSSERDQDQESKDDLVSLPHWISFRVQAISLSPLLCRSQLTDHRHYSPLFTFLLLFESPKTLELSATDALVAAEHLEALKDNGFELIINDEAEMSKRVKLISLPVSKDVVFGVRGEFFSWPASHKMKAFEIELFFF